MNVPKGVDEPGLMQSPSGLEEDSLLEGDQAFPQSVASCFATVVGADLLVNVAHVAADCARNDDQFIANFPVAAAIPPLPAGSIRWDNRGYQAL